MRADEWEHCRHCGHQFRPRPNGRCPKCDKGGFDPLSAREAAPPPLELHGSYLPGVIALGVTTLLIAVGRISASDTMANILVVGVCGAYVVARIFLIIDAFRSDATRGTLTMFVPFYDFHYALNVCASRTLRSYWAASGIAILMVGMVKG